MARKAVAGAPPSSSAVAGESCEASDKLQPPALHGSGSGAAVPASGSNQQVRSTPKNGARADQQPNAYSASSGLSLASSPGQSAQAGASPKAEGIGVMSNGIASLQAGQHAQTGQAAGQNTGPGPAGEAGLNSTHAQMPQAQGSNAGQQFALSDSPPSSVQAGMAAGFDKAQSPGFRDERAGQQADAQAPASHESFKAEKSGAELQIKHPDVVEPQSNGDGLAASDPSAQTDDATDLDLLADAPQLIDPPSIAGQENFTQSLFAD